MLKMQHDAAVELLGGHIEAPGGLDLDRIVDGQGSWIFDSANYWEKEQKYHMEPASLSPV